MRRYTLRGLAVVALATAAALTAVFWPGSAGSSPSPANKVFANQLGIELGTAKPLFAKEQPLSSGVMYALLAASGELDRRAQSVPSVQPRLPSANATSGCQNTYGAGTIKNIRVNQDCSYRRQAEEVIAINPTNTHNLIAGQNDSRIGFNHCGYDWSFDGGKTWGDQVPPFWQFLQADGASADACSDPTVTFDHAGNAYVGGVLFDVNFAASSFIVEKSNAGIGGQFYHTPNSALSFQTFRDTPPGVVAADNDGCIAHDKEFIVADATTGLKENNVYATWTRFDFCTGEGVGAHSPIYFSQSTDGGATWSAGVEISGSNATACTAFSGESDANACDQDQGSHPIVGPDGTIYVAFFNGNTPNLGENQHMIVKCAVGDDCSDAGNWTSPVKISDDFGFQPFGPVASTACPAGRQCLPPNGYRVQDETYGSVSVDSSGKLYFVWSDARNLGANCNPLGSAATATPPCDTDVFYSYSTDGGATWSSTTKLTPAGSAQWQPWSAVKSDGSKLFAAYYDRKYGSCETTGCNDITLTTITNPATATPTITNTRVTTSSMPNLVVANNPAQAGFLGDYMWVAAAGSGNVPRIVWADTRGLNGTVEEDIYTNG